MNLKGLPGMIYLPDSNRQRNNKNKQGDIALLRENRLLETHKHSARQTTHTGGPLLRTTADPGADNANAI